MIEMNVYQMAVNNVARFIKSQKPDDNDFGCMHVITAFDASVILAAAFCKSQDEVLIDIYRAGNLI